MKLISGPTLVTIPLENVKLYADWWIPQQADGLIVFSNGSSCSRFNLCNRLLMQQFHEQGLGTLLVDLLTIEEDEDYSNRLNVDLLATRLVQVTAWCRGHLDLQELPIGYLGDNTAASSALKAATQLSNSVRTVVSRGSRPDRILSHLATVPVPVLLVVSLLEGSFIRKNQSAYDGKHINRNVTIFRLDSPDIAERASIPEQARLMINWFRTHLHS